MRRRIVVLGAQGMLGTTLVPGLTSAGWDVLSYDIQDADITRPDEIRALIEAARPRAVVHGAAMTDVDGCEKDPDRAYRINAIGTRNVAAACRENNVELLYVSTDFVFDGRKTTPYLEADPVHPLGVYGQSKEWGERFVREATPRHYIVRTQWLFGPGGKNFVDTMRRLMTERNEIAVVADQVGCPTATRDLTEALRAILDSGGYGTYHASCQGEVSWFGLTETIARAVDYQGKLVPTTAAIWNAPAPRPAFSALRNMHLALTVGDPCRSWSEAVEEHIRSHPESS
jgi:dTDP-4-dehydrorhamnose reductase